MKSKEVWFEGRINRREYFARGIVCLSLILLALAPVFLHIVSFGRRAFRCVPEELFGIPVVIIAIMLSFGYILPASVRRLHDFGRSGWWLFGLVVLDNIITPMAGKVGMFIWKTAVNLLLSLWPGTKGPNEYGEVPRFEVRKLMGRRFAIILAVMYVIEAALCGWAIVERRAMAIPIPQAEVEGMLANLAKADESRSYDQFNQRMDGHRLILTNLTVRTVYGKGRGWKEVACKTGDGVNVLLYVSSQVMDALPRDLVDTDRISRVEGGVFVSLEDLNGFDSVRPRQSNAILLEAGQIDVPWKAEQLPTIDLAVSGDELVQMTADLKGEPQERDQKCARLCRPLVGRTLEFSECRVAEFRLDAKIPCVTLVSLNPESHRDGIRFSVPIDAEKGSPHALRELHVGQKLRAVRAVVCEKDDEGEESEGLTAGVWMHLLKFATDEPIVALPPFDGTAITGDELVALLRAHKNRLSPIQIDELQRRLSGRRLTFTGMRLRSYGGANDEINSADFAFSDIGLQLSVELKPVTGKKFDSLKLEALTGVAAKESANDTYGDRALRLTDGEVK